MLCVGLELGFLISSVTFFTLLGRRSVMFSAFSLLFARPRLGSLSANTAPSGTWGLACRVLEISMDDVTLEGGPIQSDS